MEIGNVYKDGQAGRETEMRYLAQEEKAKSRKLWEQCFPEDSARFVDYYYREKCLDNRILAIERPGKDGGREIISMLHRNPYRIFWGGREYNLDYVVGVATEPGWRHKGCMRALINRMLSDEYREGMPFSFLMPADPAIYEPFGFAYVYDQPEYCLTGRGDGLRRERVKDGNDAVKAGRWLDGWLRKRYGLFAVRDEAYMLRLLKEIESEYGDWELLYDGERMVGMECFWGKEKREIRFLYAEEEYLACTKSRPAIMARIVNLEEMVGNICLKEGEETVKLGITDGQIQENNGLFSWHLTENGSRIQRVSRDIPEDIWTVSIGELTGWLLGYVSPRALFNRWSRGRQAGSFREMWEFRAAGGVFLDEIV